MTIEKLLKQGVTSLSTRVSKDEAWADCERLLGHILYHDTSWLIAHGDRRVSPWKAFKFRRLVERRLQEEPMPYLLEYTTFRHLKLHLNRYVLIPRRETEDLIDIALTRERELRDPTCILDIGTGSGAIILSMASENTEKSALFFATDISARALDVAKLNAERTAPVAQIHFLKTPYFSDKLQQAILASRPRTLLLLANLPYVPEEDKPTMDKSVLAYEPHSALFAKNHGRADIDTVLTQLSDFLQEHPLPTIALFECDPVEIVENKKTAEHAFPGATIIIHPDHCGRNRFLEVRKEK